MVGRCAPKTEADAQHADFIARLVAAAPPLSDERLAELRELIRIGRAARAMIRAGDGRPTYPPGPPPPPRPEGPPPPPPPPSSCPA